MWELIKTATDNHNWTPGKRGAGYIHARTNTPDSVNLLDYSIRTWNIGPDDTDDIDRELRRHRPIDVVVFKFHITPSGGVIPTLNGFQNRTSRPDEAVISFLHRENNLLHDGRDETKFAKKTAKDSLKEFLSSIFPRHSHSLTWIKGGRGRGLMLNDGTLITWPVDKKGDPQHADMYEYLTSTKLPEAHSVQDFTEGTPFDIYEDGTLAFFSDDVSFDLVADLSKIDFRLRVAKSKKKFTKEDAFDLLDKNNWNFDANEFWMGMNDELEHEDVTHGDPEMTAKIVADHLREHPDYYTQLRTKISNNYPKFNFHFNHRTGEPCDCFYGNKTGKRYNRRQASQAVRKIKNQDQKHLRSDEGQEILNFLHKMISGHSIEEKGEFGHGRLPGVEGMVPWIVKQIKDGYIIPIHKDKAGMLGGLWSNPADGRRMDDIEGNPIVDMAFFWGSSPEQTPWDVKTEIAKSETENSGTAYLFNFEPEVVERISRGLTNNEHESKVTDKVSENTKLIAARINTKEDIKKLASEVTDKSIPVIIINSLETSGNDYIPTPKLGELAKEYGLNVVSTRTPQPAFALADDIRQFMIRNAEVTNQQIAEAQIPIDNRHYHTIPWAMWQKWFNATGSPARQGKNIMEMTPFEVRSASMDHEAYLDDIEKTKRYKEYFGKIKDSTKVYDIQDPEFEGWTVNQIKDWEACEAVGDVLGHCIGSDEQPYKESISNGETPAFMLCDPEGLPHVAWHYNPYDGELAHVQGKSGSLTNTETEKKYRALVTEFNNETERDDHDGTEGSGWVPDPPYDHYIQLPAPTTVEELEGQLDDPWDFAYGIEDMHDWRIGEDTEIDMGDPDWAAICEDFAEESYGEYAMRFIKTLVDHGYIGKFLNEMRAYEWFDPEQIERFKEYADGQDEYYTPGVLMLLRFLQNHHVNVDDITPHSTPETMSYGKGISFQNYEEMRQKEPHYDWPEFHELTDVTGTRFPLRERKERAEQEGREYTPASWDTQYLLPFMDPRILKHEVQHNPDAPIPPADVGSMAFRNVSKVYEVGYNGDIRSLHFNPETGEPCYCGYKPKKKKEELPSRTASDAVRKVKNQGQKMFRGDEGMATLDALNVLISGVPLGANDQGKVGEFPGLEKLVPWFIKQIKEERIKYDPSWDHGFGFIDVRDETLKEAKEALAKIQGYKIGYYAPGALRENLSKAKGTIDRAANSVGGNLDYFTDAGAKSGLNVTPIKLDQEEGGEPKWVEVKEEENDSPSFPRTFGTVEGAEAKDLDSFDTIIYRPYLFTREEMRKDSPSLPEVARQLAELRKTLGPNTRIILDTNTPSANYYNPDELAKLNFFEMRGEEYLPYDERPTDEDAIAFIVSQGDYTEEEVRSTINEAGRSSMVESAKNRLIYERMLPHLEHISDLAEPCPWSRSSDLKGWALMERLNELAVEGGKHPLKMSEVKIPRRYYSGLGGYALQRISNWVNATNSPARKSITDKSLKGAVNRAIKRLAYLQKLHEDTGRGRPVDTEPTYQNIEFVELVNRELNLGNYNDPRMEVFSRSMAEATAAVSEEEAEIENSGGVAFESDRERNNAILEKTAEIALPQYEINPMNMTPADILRYSDSHQRYVEYMEELAKIKEYYAEEEPADVVHRFQDPEHEGWTVVRLDDEDGEQLTMESRVLKHCIGESDNPNYREAIVNGTIDAFSIRDEDNIPKATWHFNPDGTLAHIQCRRGSSSEAVEEFRPLITEFNELKGYHDDNGGVGDEQTLNEYGEVEEEEEEQTEFLHRIELGEISTMYDLIHQYDNPYDAAEEYVDMLNEDGDIHYTWDAGTNVYQGDIDFHSIAYDFFDETNGDTQVRQRIFEIAHEENFLADLVSELDHYLDQRGPQVWKERIEGIEDAMNRPGLDQTELPLEECEKCEGKGILNEGQENEKQCFACDGTGRKTMPYDNFALPSRWQYITDENNEFVKLYEAFRAIHTNPSTGEFEEPDYITKEVYEKLKESMADNAFVDYMPKWEGLYGKFGPNFIVNQEDFWTGDDALTNEQQYKTHAYLPTKFDPRSYQGAPVRERVDNCIQCKGTGMITAPWEDGIIRSKRCDVCEGRGYTQRIEKDVKFGPGGGLGPGDQTVYEHDDDVYDADIEGLGQIPGQTYMAKLTTKERAAAWDLPAHKLSKTQAKYVNGEL